MFQINDPRVGAAVRRFRRTSRPLVAASALVVALGLGARSEQAARAAETATATTNDPNAIMQRVYRAGGSVSRSGRLKLVITGAGGDVRERTMNVRSKVDGSTRKSFVRVEDPSDVRGTGFASIEYAGGAQQPERWLYLPTIKRTSRVAGGQTATSFLGSDFSYADLSEPDPALLVLSLEKDNEVVDGEPCWVIDAKPKDDKARDESGYSSAELWISKSKWAVMRVKLNSTAAGRIKYLQASNFQQTGGAWLPQKVVCRTVQDGKLKSESVLSTLEIKTDPTVTDEDFTKHRLEEAL